MVKEEKKTYPSQINTKSIACRIPASDYVTFLNDAIKKGINLNDWLLTKVYSNNNSIGNEIELDEYKNEYEAFKDLIDNKIIRSHKGRNGYIYFTLKVEDKGNYPLELVGKDYAEKIDYYDKYELLIDELNDLKEEYDNVLNKKSFNIDDIKRQISVIAKSVYNNNSDYKEFMSEVNELLSELK